ncbi:ankyrin repeat domain-containing protein [Bradyrhizobium sp. AUGA SZCCT0431]|uniref:ankyrin repeat domain-containing protein n=1 Tax=Bradyrhizobium sp. AUGA SZCCT0431 TaxID=2807674 RepID=UPI001BA9E069|nr:ankyrin repeat domain-containing protein [Bradyrhizobium sp. AUGA SZCCT0431]MBR1146103.1 ankyrin repeat domain-containing protein [Bradyrhizobium sp. AUGA SZCCT0431]
MAASINAKEEERCRKYRDFKAIDDAYRKGDIDALLVALGDPSDFPNSLHPWDLGLGDFPLEYAIYWSPLAFIETLLDHGANPNYLDRAGFPSLIAALSTDRPDRLELLRLLLSRGADIAQRGVNDWTPLHYAVSRDDVPAIELLLAHGADVSARTRIDDFTTPLEEAKRLNHKSVVDALKRSTSA